MSTINKTQIPGFMVSTNIEQHAEIKEKVLPFLTTGIQDNTVDDYYSDNVHATDWSRARDKDRQWAKIFEPYLNDILMQVTKSMGYDVFNVDELWYQQYYQDQTHGWHTHGSNFTGVYYIEYAEDSPATQIINSYNQDQMMNLDVKEGSMVIFPSYTIHRGPRVTNNTRKTIISFNWNMVNPDMSTLQHLQRYG